MFFVRGTDDVGNQGNPVSYTWKVGESIRLVYEKKPLAAFFPLGNNEICKGGIIERMFLTK